jgi:hypothetical protein
LILQDELFGPSRAQSGLMAKRKRYDAKKAVRAMARERVGTVPAHKVIVPKTERKRPKHKKPILTDEL